MKQTAVEWLVEKWLKYDLNLGKSGFSLLLKQAKKMEKEQIKNAWLNSLTKGDFNSADEYYNQTYKSE